MKNINEFEFNELTKEELQSINGGEDGDFLYFVGYAVGWISAKLKQAGNVGSDTIVTVGHNNPVGTWN